MSRDKPTTGGPWTSRMSPSTLGNLVSSRRERTRSRFIPWATEVEVASPALHPEPRGVLDGAFRILRSLPFIGPEGQVTELSRTTGIPRSSVYRLLEQLHEVGAVDVADGSYALAPEILLLANLAEPTVGLREAIWRPMRLLRERTGATVSFVVAQKDQPFVLEVVPGREVLPVDIYPGRDMPPGSAATLVLQPGAPPDRMRNAGRSASDREDVVKGLTCYATSVHLPSGRRGALQLSCTNRIPAENFASLADQLAASISGELRHTES